MSELLLLEWDISVSDVGDPEASHRDGALPAGNVQIDMTLTYAVMKSLVMHKFRDTRNDIKKGKTQGVWAVANVMQGLSTPSLAHGPRKYSCMVIFQHFLFSFVLSDPAYYAIIFSRFEDVFFSHSEMHFVVIVKVFSSQLGNQILCNSQIVLFIIIHFIGAQHTMYMSGSLVQSRCGEAGCCKQVALSCAHSVSAPLDLSLLVAHKLLRLYDAQLGTVWGQP
ncbi:hypothetical protein MG293_001848 [Ovis ammon polii]|uniref:Uncharacterized protein n=1 Tax=Ovis ammon polii TaxID=230172 RepID=A0AAD4UN63_OVIAM|nr:hypothetical protein MG293_001848 [Ovis ammon polii]